MQQVQDNDCKCRNTLGLLLHIVKAELPYNLHIELLYIRQLGWLFKKVMVFTIRILVISPVSVNCVLEMEPIRKKV